MSDQLARMFSTSAMREYSLPCSFFASSYSLFSLRSPKDRACSAFSPSSSWRAACAAARWRACWGA